MGDGQKSDLEKAAVLGRKLVAGRRRARPGQGRRALSTRKNGDRTERLNQLRSLMPTQRMVVRVPFADNQNDARIFCSQGSQLRPIPDGLARETARGGPGDNDFP